MCAMRILKKIPIHPTFILIFLWFLISGKTIEFFTLFFVLLFHELGHYLVAKKLGYKLNGFYLAPYGVALNYKDGKFLSYDEVKIALAGPFANFLFSFVMVGLWWIFPFFYAYTCDFAYFSFFLGLFNLLPAYPLDGGRILVSLLSEKIQRKTALNVSIYFNVFFSILFFVSFVISCSINYNPTLALMVVFLLGGIIDSKFECKYDQVNLFNKKLKDFSHVKFLMVSDEVTLGEMMRAIDLSKFTLFYIITHEDKVKVMTEKMVLKLCLKEPITKKIKELNIK